MQHSTTTQQCSTAVQHSTTTQQCSTAHQPPYSPPFLLTLESLSLAQTVSDLGMRLRGDLPTERAGLPDWCANPLGDRRESGRPPRVATRRRPATCAELACWVRRPPRVVIAVPIPRVIVESVDVHPPRVAIAGPNRGFSRLDWSAQPTLLVSIPGAAPSSSRYRGVNPADKIPYRPWCNQTVSDPGSRLVCQPRPFLRF